MILGEFDKEKTAVINPWNIIKPVKGISKIAVACYSHITFERMIHELDAEIIAETSSANGVKPVYQAKYKENDIALFMIDVGAPMSVGMLEDVYQMGVEKIIVFGTCGVLDCDIADCSILIPNSAVRDEGTSYHYAEPADEICVNETYLQLFTNLLNEWGIKYTVGKVWTTDAFYRETAETSSANGVKPVYQAKYKENDIALFMIDVGAPMSVGMLEDVYQMGVEKIIVFGTCGVLDCDIADCSILIPNSAVRDEGTSYHYAEPADEICVNETYLQLFTNLLNEWGIKYTVGKVWTTDAFYRETKDKVKRRKEQGCICVDMECSANAAVAQFRGKELIQFFYVADNLDSEEWDVRSVSNYDKLEEKDRIAVIALELALKISNCKAEKTDDNDMS